MDPRRQSPAAGPTPRWAPDAPEALHQEFAAGTHPGGRELVLRAPDAHRTLVVAVDPGRQRGLADLLRATPTVRASTGEVAARWRVLHTGVAPSAVRLDLRFRRPVTIEVRVLLTPDSPIVRHAPVSTRLCLASSRAFDAIERTGFCGPDVVVLPVPPTDVLVEALGLDAGGRGA